MERGRIVKALSGFYYVDSGNGTLTQCRARGRFRSLMRKSLRNELYRSMPAPEICSAFISVMEAKKD